MSVPVYECPVCGTRQPVSDVDQDDPPVALGNTTCAARYGGCLRMSRLELVPEATWEPVEWTLHCPACEYETRAWGEVGFADSARWDCPDCHRAMTVLDVTQLSASSE